MGEFRQVRLYRPGDEEGIIKLFREVFGREMSLQEWQWKYIESHPLRVYSSVAEDDLGNIVGHYGAVHVPLIYRGKSASGLSICDVMIHPQFRSIRALKAISSLTPPIAVQDHIIMGYGFPTINILLRPAIALKLYEEVENVLEGNKEAVFHNNLSRLKFKLFPLDYNDDRIDKLWEICKMDLPLAAVRNRQYLCWRYKKHPLFRYELLGLKKRLGNELVGIVVLKREEDRVILMDFLALKGIMSHLFQKMENYIVSTGARTIRLWFPPFLENEIKGIGYSIKNAPTIIPCTTFEKALRKKDVAGFFFYTMGDTDFM